MIEELVTKIHISESPLVSESAISGLIDFTRNDTRKDVVESLIYIPRKHTTHTGRMNTLQALKAVLETPVVDDTFVIDDVLPKLLDYFRNGTEEEKIHSLGVLSVIAGKNSVLRHVILNAGISLELVNMLKEGNAALKLEVEKLVVDFAEDNPAAAVELSDAGAIPEFIGLLRKGTELNFEAGKFLGMLASSTSPQTEGLLDGTAVSEFLKDLKIGNERLKASSGTILRKMARNCSPKQLKALADAA